jgi:hypothetical protein
MHPIAIIAAIARPALGATVGLMTYHGLTEVGDLRSFFLSLFVVLIIYLILLHPLESRAEGADPASRSAQPDRINSYIYPFIALVAIAVHELFVKGFDAYAASGIGDIYLSFGVLAVFFFTAVVSAGWLYGARIFGRLSAVSGAACAFLAMLLIFIVLNRSKTFLEFDPGIRRSLLAGHLFIAAFVGFAGGFAFDRGAPTRRMLWLAAILGLATVAETLGADMYYEHLYPSLLGRPYFSYHFPIVIGWIGGLALVSLDQFNRPTRL